MILNGFCIINDNEQYVYVTVTVDGDDCQFIHIAPAILSGQDLQNYVDAKEDSYKFDILRDMYPTAPDSDKISLSALEAWAATHAKEKVAWVNQHPDIIPASGTEKSNLIVAAKDLVNSLTYDDIDNHIENVFGGLSTAQKSSLKKLYKAVLFLLKKG